MALTALGDGVEYLFEGDVLLPQHAAEIGVSWGDRVKTVFLGYAETSPEAKLRGIRAFGGGPNDWVSDLSDERVPDIATTNIRFSRCLRRACAAHGLPYFDTSRDFPQTVEAALRHLASR